MAVFRQKARIHGNRPWPRSIGCTPDDRKSETQSERKYDAKAYDEIKVRVPKGRKEVLQTHAAQRGESLNGFINLSIDEQLERDGAAVEDSK